MVRHVIVIICFDLQNTLAIVYLRNANTIVCKLIDISIVNMFLVLLKTLVLVIFLLMRKLKDKSIKMSIVKECFELQKTLAIVFLFVGKCSCE